MPPYSFFCGENLKCLRGTTVPPSVISKCPHLCIVWLRRERTAAILLQIDVPAASRWLNDVSPFAHAFAAMISSEFTGLETTVEATGWVLSREMWRDNHGILRHLSCKQSASVRQRAGHAAVTVEGSVQAPGCWRKHPHGVLSVSCVPDGFAHDPTWHNTRGECRLRFGHSSSMWTPPSWSTISRCWASLRAVYGSWPSSQCGSDGAPAWSVCHATCVPLLAARYRVKTYHRCFKPMSRDKGCSDVPTP